MAQVHEPKLSVEEIVELLGLDPAGPRETANAIFAELTGRKCIEPMDLTEVFSLLGVWVRRDGRKIQTHCGGDGCDDDALQRITKKYRTFLASLAVRRDNLLMNDATWFPPDCDAPLYLSYGHHGPFLLIRVKQLFGWDSSKDIGVRIHTDFYHAERLLSVFIFPDDEKQTATPALGYLQLNQERLFDSVPASLKRLIIQETLRREFVIPRFDLFAGHIFIHIDSILPNQQQGDE